MPPAMLAAMVVPPVVGHLPLFCRLPPQNDGLPPQNGAKVNLSFILFKKRSVISSLSQPTRKGVSLPRCGEPVDLRIWAAARVQWPSGRHADSVGGGTGCCAAFDLGFGPW